MSPSLVRSVTEVMPGPPVTTRSTGIRSRVVSQRPSSSTLGLYDSPSTTAEVISAGLPSSAAASMERQPVIRVHARSVSPGV